MNFMKSIHIYETSQDPLAKDDDEDRVYGRNDNDERLHNKETENEKLDERRKIDVVDTDKR